MEVFLVCALILFVACEGPPQQPVIGIYTVDGIPPVTLPPVGTFFHASYVKYLQMNGAQVIPLHYHYSKQKIQELLGKINGVLIPGGAQNLDDIDEWTSKLAFIVDYAIQQNEEGNQYPIWGTCLGFQALMYITSGLESNATVFSDIDEEVAVIRGLKVWNRESQLLSKLNSQEQDDIQKGVFYFHHHYAVLKETFDDHENWHNFWHLTSTSSNPSGVEFVSMVQGKKYPFFGVQFHPEKTIFEWRANAPRTYNAISSAQKIISTFVEVARKNKNSFADGEELKKILIYNWQPTLTSEDVLLTYIFDESKLP